MSNNKANDVKNKHNLKYIMLFSLSIFLLIALVSYDSNDPGFTKSFENNMYVLNLEGIVGAWLADFLLYFFGITAYLLPLYVTSTALLSIMKKKALDIYNHVGIILFILSIDALLSLYVSNFNALPAGIGGIIGEVIAWKMISYLSITGASFVLITLVLCSISLIFPNQLFIKISSFAKYIISVTKSFCEIVLDYVKNIDFKIFTIKKKSATAIVQDEKLFTTQIPKAPNISDVTEKIIPPKEDVNITRKMIDKSDNIKMILKKNHFTRVRMPDISLLDKAVNSEKHDISKNIIIHMSKEVENKFLDFGIKLEVVSVLPGPVVTRFELKLAPGTKVSTISNLAKDLARTLQVISVRIVDVIPGKAVIGLEIPNEKRQIVRLRDIINANSYTSALSPITIILGKDISGNPVVVDLAKMPHLLVAGTTGSGKSVGLNAMILSFLYKSSSEQLRMILIDPKMLELSVYDDIPHLLTPVITDMSEAAGALKWCVTEMEKRYKLMSILGVRNVAGYNDKVIKANNDGTPLLDPLYESIDGESDPPTLETLPTIVVVVDEYADMIMVLGKKVEQLIARLAQKARAAGIHLVLATQRPSVNVVTGLIKANIPTRIAFQVSSRIDSRTVLDQQGAEQLLGHGDMLYLAPGTGVPIRVHGAYVSDDEVHRVVKFIKDNNPPPEYVSNMIAKIDFDGDGDNLDNTDGEKDPLYDEAVAIVLKTKKVSISSIQRKLKIGYNRSANIVESMEKAGLVSEPSQSNGTREVLANDN